MAEVAISKCIGAGFQPDDTGANFTERADPWLIYAVVDNDGGHEQVQGCIDSMRYSDIGPSWLKS